MIKNGGNLCYKLDFAAATSCRDTRKVGGRARVGSAYIVGGWRTEVMFNTSSAALPAKDPRQGTPCSGANKTPSSLLTAVLTKITSENCCSPDMQSGHSLNARAQRGGQHDRFVTWHANTN